MAVQPIPDGFHAVTPYLVCQNASKVIDFLKRAFDAQEIHRSARPDGTVMHAQLKIGDSMVMLSDSMGDKYPPSPTSLYLYVTDTDAAYRNAMKAGGVSILEPMDQFYGDRNAGVKDPGGNQWWVATHVEDVTREEMERRQKDFMEKQSRG